MTENELLNQMTIFISIFRFWLKLNWYTLCNYFNRTIMENIIKDEFLMITDTWTLKRKTVKTSPKMGENR